MVDGNQDLASGNNSSHTAQSINQRVVLVTVHGTGAGDESATGDRWWQLGSRFLTELGKRLDLDPDRVEISPFQWEEGPNSETERRAAGKKLYEKLLGYENAGTDYYIIAHSHGGSVTYSALLQSVKQQGPLTHLKSWCTVGTPFLDYRQNRFLFQRLGNWGLTFYMAGIVSIILGLCAWITLNRIGPDADLSALRFALISFGVACLLGLFLYERVRKKSWFSAAQQRKLATLYSERWFGLWHVEDEAISALTNVAKVKVSIIPSTFLIPFVAIVQLSIVMLIGAYGAVDILFDDAFDILDFLAPPEDESASLDSDSESFFGVDAAYLLILFVLYIPIFLLVVGVITIVLKFITAQLGKPLSKILNSVIWSSVRQRAWGDDVLKEDVKAIAAHPPEFVKKFAPLPASAEVPLRDYSSKYAIETLERVREVLGMKPGSTSSPDFRSELTENLKWKELIHTAYFEVSEFIDLVAFIMHKAELAELTTEFEPAPEVEAFFNSSQTALEQNK